MMLSSRIALVTGSAQGLGRAIALRLAEDGFNIALNDIPANQAKLDGVRLEIEAKRRRVAVVVADVSAEDQVERMVDQTTATLGRLDVMVANAGIFRGSLLLDQAVVDWDRVFSINTRGVFLCYKYAAKQMIAQGNGGKIIGACSIAGKRGEAGLAAYCASKFAVRGLTEAAASELGRHRINVNCYAPGVVGTPMGHQLSMTVGGFDRLEQAERSHTPLGRLGQERDVADVVSFLASDAADWVTGQAISIDGGRGLWGTPWRLSG